MGVSPSDLLLTSQFGITTNSGYGADGLSGAAWQEAIECRALAAYNVGFGGFAGYNWTKNDQAADNATILSYVKAYASAMVLQSEVPCWTGNNSDVTGNSWSDYLNWTGGLPSTVNAPYPLLASANPNLPKQTSASFLANANPSASGTTITLDGNQSITHLTFDSANSYTIAPGTGGSLTLTGSGASIAVNSGSHSISAGVMLSSNIAPSITGNLSFTGSVNNTGHTLTKSGAGMLIISGPQSNSAGSAITVTGGNVSLNSDAGSAVSQTLALSASAGGSITLNNRAARFLLLPAGRKGIDRHDGPVRLHAFAFDHRRAAGCGAERCD